MNSHEDGTRPTAAGRHPILARGWGVLGEGESEEEGGHAGSLHEPRLALAEPRQRTSPSVEVPRRLAHQSLLLDKGGRGPGGSGRLHDDVVDDVVVNDLWPGLLPQ